ncbi:unnamed protein product, partial [Mesorhabditis spiculigera]
MERPYKIFTCRRLIKGLRSRGRNAGKRNVCGGRKGKNKDDEQKLAVDATTGAVCIAKPLDYEVEQSLQAVIEAIDHLGSTATTTVSIDIDDVNDNVPVFYPEYYNITIREGEINSDSNRELLVVQASDADSGLGGEVQYNLRAGDAGLFRVDPRSGAISLREGLSKGEYSLQISATDGLGQAAHTNALVQVSVIGILAAAPKFSQAKYEFHTTEDILPGISIGGVEATGGPGIRYSIYNGDPDHHFTIHPETGKITVARYLDADKQDTVLLNVRADLIDGLSNHTQVRIHIEDHNDNPPEFTENVMEVIVREDAKPQQTFFIVQAIDKDKKKNGELTYSLMASIPIAPVMIQPVTGHLVLTAPLDYERIREYRIRVKAQDNGIPPRSTNATVILRVSDVNDNAPIFENATYEVEVFEHAPAKTHLIQVKAVDFDSEENGRVEYRLDQSVDAFGIDPRGGTLFTKKDLDREVKMEHNLTVYAYDAGSPSKSGSAVVRIHVKDINDHSPQCVDQAITVNTDADTRKPFGTLLAIDPDSGENGTLTFRSQHAHPNFIVKGNGEIYLRTNLISSKSSEKEQKLPVIVSDGGVPSRSTVCHFTIRVEDGNSKVELIQPVLNTIRIRSECDRGCRLIKINATNVAVWQIQSSEFSALFSISAQGILSLTSPPSATQPFRLTLVLSDDEGRQILLPLRIIPYKDFKGERMLVSVPLNTPIGTKLVDANERNSSVYYSLLNTTELVEVDEATGSLFLTSKPTLYSGQVIDLYMEKGSLTGCDTNMHVVSLEIEQKALKPRFEKNLFLTNLSEATIPGT